MRYFKKPLPRFSDGEAQAALDKLFDAINEPKYDLGGEGK